MRRRLIWLGFQILFALDTSALEYRVASDGRAVVFMMKKCLQAERHRSRSSITSAGLPRGAKSRHYEAVTPPASKTSSFTRTFLPPETQSYPSNNKKQAGHLRKLNALLIPVAGAPDWGLLIPEDPARSGVFAGELNHLPPFSLQMPHPSELRHPFCSGRAARGDFPLYPGVYLSYLAEP